MLARGPAYIQLQVKFSSKTNGPIASRDLGGEACVGVPRQDGGRLQSKWMGEQSANAHLAFLSCLLMRLGS